MSISQHDEIRFYDIQRPVKRSEASAKTLEVVRKAKRKLKSAGCDHAEHCSLYLWQTLELWLRRIFKFVLLHI